MSNQPTKTECECGCGGATKGGRFLPGHDAKLKRDLIEAAMNGSKRAETKLEKLDWTKFLDAKRAKAAATRKPDAKPAKAGDRRRSPRSPEPETTKAETAPPTPRRRGRPRKAAPETPEAGTDGTTAAE